MDRKWNPEAEVPSDRYERFDGDITIESVNAAAVEATLTSFGQLDGLVLNAGVASYGATVKPNSVIVRSALT